MENNIVRWINNFIDKEKKDGKRFIEKIVDENNNKK